MADLTKIEWCDATVNAWWGCTKVSEGCKHCYADAWSKRHGRAVWGPKGTRIEVKSWRATLDKVSRRAKAESRRLRVFCQSMSDTFEGPETMGGVESENWAAVSRLREELLCAVNEHPELDFLVLTKRPENVMLWGPTMMEWVREGFPPNFWIGTSIEDQATADERIPPLLRCPAAVRFLSCEPLLSGVHLSKWLGREELDCPHCGGEGSVPVYADFGDRPYDPGEHMGGKACPVCCYDNRHFMGPKKLHWCIVGGESGPNARPMNPDWAWSIRDQCVAVGVAFFYKQWGEWAPMSSIGHESYWMAGKRVIVDATGKTTPVTNGNRGGLKALRDGGTGMAKVGKHRAGRLLDGRTWDEFPEVGGE